MVHCSLFGVISGGRNASELVNADDPNVLEIWNLVFMQYNRTTAGGALQPLPALHIDTGLGLERLTSILQGKTSNYDTDIFEPILAAIHREFCVSGAERASQLPPYARSEFQSSAEFLLKHGGLSQGEQRQERQRQERDLAYRVIADHLRTAAVAIADGTQLSSGGRGYVIRRVLRRALRYSQLLSKESLALAGAPPSSSPSSGQAGGGASLASIVPVVVQQLRGVYPELMAAQELIERVILDEERSFAALLTRGLKFLEDKMAELAAAGGRGEEGGVLTIAGEDVFYLYDTLGFPVDLTELIVDEHNQSRSSRGSHGVTFRLDMSGYEAAMRAQRQRASEASAIHKQALLGQAGVEALVPSMSALHALTLQQVPDTDDSFKFFHAADTIDTAVLARADSDDGDGSVLLATVLKVYTNEGGFESRASEQVVRSGGVFGVLLDRTCFYAEAGGQVADSGVITVTQAGGARSITARVIDVQAFGKRILHTCMVLSPETDADADADTHAVVRDHSDTSDVEAADLFREGATCELRVDVARRNSIAPNHTMTHVLNQVLREVLHSATIDQKGSLVSAEKMRFDFSHDKALSLDAVEAVEARVNEIIAADVSVHTTSAPLDAARRLPGVRAVFGEHYPDPVRVVGIGLARSLDEMVAQEVEEDPCAGGVVHPGGHSIEFCGGTHLRSTGQALAWVVLEETAVAKGVRRVVAVSGRAALAAQKQGRVLSERGEKLAQSIDEFVRGASVHLGESSLQGSREGDEVGRRLEGLEGQLGSLKDAVEQAEVSLTVLHPLRHKLQKCQKDLFGCRKKYVAAAVDSSVERLLEQSRLQQQRVVGHHCAAVLEMTLPSLVSCDASVMKVVTQRLQEGSPPGFSFLVLCPDLPKGQLRCFSAVSAERPGGLSAADWVLAVTSALGGKGGGKEASAQGSVDWRLPASPTTTEGRCDEGGRADFRAAVEQAKLYLQSKLN